MPSGLVGRRRASTYVRTTTRGGVRSSQRRHPVPFGVLGRRRRRRRRLASPELRLLDRSVVRTLRLRERRGRRRLAAVLGWRGRACCVPGRLRRRLGCRRGGGCRCRIGVGVGAGVGFGVGAGFGFGLGVGFGVTGRAGAGAAGVGAGRAGAGVTTLIGWATAGGAGVGTALRGFGLGAARSTGAGGIRMTAPSCCSGTSGSNESAKRVGDFAPSPRRMTGRANAPPAPPIASTTASARTKIDLMCFPPVPKTLPRGHIGRRWGKLKRQHVGKLQV